ncbi:hypothetical protein [Streptomyces sp. CRN 30]|uniref:hypothetical protein n=1 Tax=Streptomyces sp. CRN 30 TaxID=3075613 RepID=UPI002A8217B2|nr:hypothetical protein [Streptomyces sp. CRN 30]
MDARGGPLRGAADDELEKLWARSHVTRSAITRPLVTLRLLVPDPARAAHHRFIDAAAAYCGTHV